MPWTVQNMCGVFITLLFFSLLSRFVYLCRLLVNLNVFLRVLKNLSLVAEVGQMFPPRNQDKIVDSIFTDTFVRATTNLDLSHDLASSKTGFFQVHYLHATHIVLKSVRCHNFLLWRSRSQLDSIVQRCSLFYLSALFFGPSYTSRLLVQAGQVPGSALSGICIPFYRTCSLHVRIDFPYFSFVIFNFKRKN